MPVTFLYNFKLVFVFTSDLSFVEALLREFTGSICMVDSNNSDQVVEDRDELHKMLHDVSCLFQLFYLFMQEEYFTVVDCHSEA